MPKVGRGHALLHRWRRERSRCGRRIAEAEIDWRSMAAALTSAEQQGGAMSTIVIVHGAWGGSWAWRKCSQVLRDNGHEVFTPTLTGLGYRSHLLTPEVGLEHHIRDVSAVLEYEDLAEIALVG